MALQQAVGETIVTYVYRVYTLQLQQETALLMHARSPQLGQWMR